MNIKRIQLIQGKGELNSRAGNYFSALVLGNLPSDILPENFYSRRSDAIFDRDILLTLIGLLCNGHTDFSDVNQYKGDRLFAAAYGISRLPSEATLRQRLDEMPLEQTHGLLRKLNLKLLRKRIDELGSVEAGGLDLIPVDMDVSPMDNSRSSKQRSSRTYKGFDGFSPLLTYIGLVGYMLDCELREGKQHCQKGTPETIARVLEQIRGLGLAGRCLVRMDSGNDAAENLDLLFKAQADDRSEMIPSAVEAIRNSGALELTRNVANDYIDKAIASLDGIPESQELKSLFDLAEYVQSRSY